MKIATWNVNSLKVRQQHVIDWLVTSGVDVLCLQELKLTDDKFPVAELAAVGYKSWFAGQKTYKTFENRLYNVRQCREQIELPFHNSFAHSVNVPSSQLQFTQAT